MSSYSTVLSRISSQQDSLRSVIADIDRDLTASRRRVLDATETWDAVLDAAVEASVASPSGDLPEGVLALLEQRDRARADSENVRVELAPEIDRLEAEFFRADEVAETARKTMEERRDAVLAGSPALQADRQAAGQLETQLELLDRQARETGEEAELKRSTYESDRFFTYLRQRGYGTERYSAPWPLSKGDRWLARVSDYDEKAENYAALLAVPGWLDRRADKMRRDLADAIGKIDRTASSLLGSDALYVAAQRDHLATENAARQVGEALEDVRDRHAGATRLLDAMRGGSDRFLAEADRVLRKTWRETLKSGSRGGGVPGNVLDAWSGLADILSKEESLQDRAGQERRRQQRILDDLEATESRFRRDYGSRDRFGSDADDLLALMVAGTLSADDLLGRLEQSHVPPAPQTTADWQSPSAMSGSSGSSSSWNSSDSIGGSSGGSSWSTTDSIGGSDFSSTSSSF